MVGMGTPPDQVARVVPLGDDRVNAAKLVQHYEREASARYGSFIRSLMRPMYYALRAGVVEGYAGLSGRRTVGAVFFARYGGLGRITFLHVLDDLRGQGLEEELLAWALDDLMAEPGSVQRIVAEPMITSHARPELAFEARGMATVEREIMLASTNGNEPRGQRIWPPVRGRSIGRGEAALTRRGSLLVLRGFKPGDATGSAAVLRLANQGSVDGLIYPELLDERQVLAAVKGICGGSCGRFDARASGVVVSPEDGICAVALVARYPASDAFVAEVAVVPDWQGQGLGSALLDRALGTLAATGCEHAALGVTTGNLRARQLYLSRGFRRVDTFVSHYWPA